MQDSSTVVVYGLCDPRDGALRYVGKSHKPDFRFYIHLWDARNRPRTRLHTWIRSLLREGIEPEQFIIEECGSDDWVEAETFWISYFRFIGCDLVNHTNGGEGLWNPTPDVRAKMSAAHKGYKFTEERKAKYSEKFRGEANPFHGKQHTEATRAKIREARTGQPSPKKGKPAPADAIYYRKAYVCISPDGKPIIVRDLPKFCEEHGLTRSNMVSVASGKWQHHKGWKCRRLEDIPTKEASGQLGFRFEDT